MGFYIGKQRITPVIHAERPWRPNPLWPDIKSIVENDTRNYPGKVGFIMYNFSDVSNFKLTATARTAIATSDGAFYTYANNGGSVTHHWDTSKDVDDGRGHKTRWMIFYYSTDSTMDSYGTTELTYGWDGNKIAYAVVRLNIGNGYYVFRGHEMLERIDNTGYVISGESFYTAFYGCYMLTEVPNIDTSQAINVGYLFTYCMSLKKIPQIDISNATNMDYFAFWCTSLKEMPDVLDTSKVTAARNAFNYCAQLKKMPRFTNMSNVTSWTYFGANSRVLVDAGEISMSSNTETFTAATSPFVSAALLDNIKLTLPSNTNMWLNSSNLISIESFRYIADHAPDVTATPRTFTIGATNIARINTKDPTIITDLQAKGWTVA